MNKLIDIVVPIYNRAHCIPNLIEELKKQTLQDFRVIFVDDGSTDDSYGVLQSILENAPFAYKLIHKENGGAASARNAALRETTGKWVAFVDSDDCMKPHYLEYMVRAVTELGADLGVCHYQTIVVEKNTPVCKDEPFSCTGMTPAECMRMYCTEWLGVYCLLISGELIRNKGLYFYEDCTYCEDMPYIADVIESATKVAHVNQQLYLYYTYQGSLSRSPKLSKFMSGIEAFHRMKNDISQRDSEAAKVFCEMANARYYIAVCRKAAVQMSYADYTKLVNAIDLRQYKKQFRLLKSSQKIAAQTLLVSKLLFYYMIRLIFRD